MVFSLVFFISFSWFRIWSSYYQAPSLLFHQSSFTTNLECQVLISLWRVKHYNFHWRLMWNLYHPISDCISWFFIGVWLLTKLDQFKHDRLKTFPLHFFYLFLLFLIFFILVFFLFFQVFINLIFVTLFCKNLKLWLVNLWINAFIRIFESIFFYHQAFLLWWLVILFFWFHCVIYPYLFRNFLVYFFVKFSFFVFAFQQLKVSLLEYFIFKYQGTSFLILSFFEFVFFLRRLSNTFERW